MLKYLGEKTDQAMANVASLVAFLALYVFPKLAGRLPQDKLQDLVHATMMLPFLMAYELASSVYQGAGSGMRAALILPGSVFAKWQTAITNTPENESQQHSQQAIAVNTTDVIKAVSRDLLPVQRLRLAFATVNVITKLQENDSAVSVRECSSVPLNVTQELVKPVVPAEAAPVDKKSTKSHKKRRRRIKKSKSANDASGQAATRRPRAV